MGSSDAKIVTTKNTLFQNIGSVTQNVMVFIFRTGGWQDRELGK
jgi:hypothetical protein